MVTKRKWKTDVKFAIETFGRDYVEKRLTASPITLDRWLSGTIEPPPESPYKRRMEGLLAE